MLDSDGNWGFDDPTGKKAITRQPDVIGVTRFDGSGIDLVNFNARFQDGRMLTTGAEAVN